MVKARIAVALSGGGHRACLWALGVLMYLGDAGRNHDVTSIASVSGGSLANGALGQRLDYRAASKGQVRALVQDVSQLIAGRGTVFGWWGTYVYLTGVVLGFAAVVLIVGQAVADWPSEVDIMGSVEWVVAVAAVLTWLRMLGARGAATARAFEHTLLARDRPKTLDGLHCALDHVLCATDLHAGHHAYFSSSWVCAYQFGHGGNGGLPLRRPMQASAAFPPVFPVVWIKTKPFKFEGGTKRPRYFALTDGGVYDNMADQWAHGLSNRIERWGDLGFREADELVVANASAALAWRGAWALRLPVLGALAALLRDKSVLYDNGTSVRRKELVRRFDEAALAERGLRGALVHIAQSPFDVPDAFKDKTALWPGRAERARAALAALGDDDSARAEWEQVAKDNAAVKTTLVGLSPEVCARLLHHAHVLATVNLHVILDYPLVAPLPNRGVFLGFVSGAGA
jgi:predicted acylesterase/phospholipase RssA